MCWLLSIHSLNTQYIFIKSSNDTIYACYRVHSLPYGSSTTFKNDSFDFTLSLFKIFDRHYQLCWALLKYKVIRNKYSLVVLHESLRVNTSYINECIFSVIGCWRMIVIDFIIAHWLNVDDYFLLSMIVSYPIAIISC